MKTQLFSVMAASVLFFSACKHAPSEQTMKDLESFEKSWSEMSGQAEVLRSELNTSVEYCAKACEKSAAIPVDGLKDEAKAELTTCVKSCADVKTELETLKSSWEAEGSVWMKVDSTYKSLKDKALKGEITDEEAVKTLNDLKAKLETGNKGLEEWKNKIAAAKESCTKSETAVAECCKKIEAAAAEDPKKKKK